MAKIPQGKKVKLLRLLPSNGEPYFHCEDCKHLVPYSEMHSNLKRAEQVALYRGHNALVLGVSAKCGACRNKHYNGG